MADIKAKDVAALRERTGVGMMDCKRALVEADGDMDKAVTILREKGIASQASKSERIAAEGLVAATVENGCGAVVEINSETDFVAQNQEFKDFVNIVAKSAIAAKPADLDGLLAAEAIGGKGTVEETLQELFLKIRENMKIRRFRLMDGILVPYVHGGGTIAVLVKLESDIAADNEKLLACGKDVALQVAAMNPIYLNRDSVSAGALEEEKRLLKIKMSEDPKMAGKPAQVLDKILEGKIAKYYEENCLLDQNFVKDGDLTVAKYVDSVAKELGGSIKVVDFVRYEKGEGIQKKEDDFAAEVAKMAGGN